MSVRLLSTLFVVLTFVACSKDEESDQQKKIIEEYRDDEVSDTLKMNQIQYLGSHNSYRVLASQALYDTLLRLGSIIPFNIEELDYTHETIEMQLKQYGVRQFELDIYADTEGGRFYNRKGNEIVGESYASNINALKQPGLKVLHIPDIDYGTNYISFKDALREIYKWSKERPTHLPVFVLIETKTEALGKYITGNGYAIAEEWDEERIFSVEKEILSVFDRKDIIAPDDVRGSYSTLNEAVLTKGWPTIGESRGKIMFMFDQTSVNEIYRKGSPSLENRIIFTSSNPDEPDGAFIKRNNANASDIKGLVEKGYLVRSMVGGTYEARSGDYSKLNLSLENGVHFLSTDYYRPDARAGQSGWTDFKVELDGHSYRINPVTQ